MKNKLEKVAKTSENIENENLQKLRAVFPNFVKDGQVDFDALQKFFDKEGILSSEEKFGLNWAGKSNAFRAIRTPATGTLVPQPEESKNWDSTENIFIEGDNLEVLKLLQKNYREKIKMIYIDPPYNTGKDFVYKDNFTQDVADYYEQTGQTKGGIKMTANTEKNGRYHSDWLTMMYPRLFLGRNLLKDDGVIFVSIDDNEVANLRIIMDEIFGEENFITSINWQKKGSPKGVPPEEMIVETHEYILVYQKNRYSFVGIKRNEEDFSNPDNDPRGKWRNTNIKSTTKSSENAFEITDPKTGFVFKDVWAFSKLELANMIKEERLIFPKTVSGQVRAKEFLNEFKNENIPLMSNWGLYDGQEATEFLDTLMGEKIFQNPKNYNLILNLIKYSSRKDDLVLDFFSGSGTTAHAVMDLNAEDEGDRKWICVQLPEITEEDSEAYKAGYKTIAEISRERIRRAGKNIGKGDIGFKSYKLSPSNYRQWNTDIGEKDEKNILKTSKLFLEKPLVDKYDEKSVVYEILVKEGFDFNSKVEPVKDLDRFDYYLVTDSLFEKKLYITFAKKVFAKQVETLKLLESDTFVCFDSALDDTTKVNLGRNINVITI